MAGILGIPRRQVRAGRVARGKRPPGNAARRSASTSRSGKNCGSDRRTAIPTAWSSCITIRCSTVEASRPRIRGSPGYRPATCPSYRFPRGERGRWSRSWPSKPARAAGPAARRAMTPRDCRLALTATPHRGLFLHALGVLHSGRVGPGWSPGRSTCCLLAARARAGWSSSVPSVKAVLGRLWPGSRSAGSAGRSGTRPWPESGRSMLAGSATLRLTALPRLEPDGAGATQSARPSTGSTVDSCRRSTGIRGHRAERLGRDRQGRSRWLRSGSVEAYGRQPDALIRALQPHGSPSVAGTDSHSGRRVISHALFGRGLPDDDRAGLEHSSSPIPRAKEALRSLLQSFWLLKSNSKRKGR